MNYNIHISAFKGRFNLLNITEEQLHKVIKAYLGGENAFTLSGETYHFGKSVSTFRIFTNDSAYSTEKLKTIEIEDGSGWGMISGAYFTVDNLLNFGREVTDEIIGDNSFGCQATAVIAPNEIFISETHIEELESLNGKCRYNLSKMIALCKEINHNFLCHNYYSVAMLLRALLNHVPPAFNGKESFDQVLADWNGPRHKTKRELLSRLNEVQRKLADLITHERLKEIEPPINRQQVSFFPEIDYLLQETIIGLKKG